MCTYLAHGRSHTQNGEDESHTVVIPLPRWKLFACQASNKQVGHACGGTRVRNGSHHLADELTLRCIEWAGSQARVEHCFDQLMWVTLSCKHPLFSSLHFKVLDDPQREAQAS